MPNRGALLVHYLACFNSVLGDSMTAMYRVMGPNVRAIGEHSDDGEGIHRSVIDRMDLAECKYDPANVKAYLARGAPSIADTTRVSRGAPCPPMH